MAVFEGLMCTVLRPFQGRVFGALSVAWRDGVGKMKKGFLGPGVAQEKGKQNLWPPWVAFLTFRLFCGQFGTFSTLNPA